MLRDSKVAIQTIFQVTIRENLNKNQSITELSKMVFINLAI